MNYLINTLLNQLETSDRKLIKELIGWAPADNLEVGLTETYNWINEQIRLGNHDAE